ncbi:glutamine amidotransferase, partial [Bifidobacterium margollesii]
MCVIATIKPGTMPTSTELAQMSDANPNGAGIAWWDGQHLHRYRNPDNHQTLAYIHHHWQAVENAPALIHFRLATHGSVCEANTHPFAYQLPDGETGYIAHNGIARRHTHGPHANDSRNAIEAWQNGQDPLTDGTQGAFAKIDHTGHLTWIAGGIELRDGITVSNLNWQWAETDPWDTLDTAWQDGWEEGYQQATQDLETGVI